MALGHRLRPLLVPGIPCRHGRAASLHFSHPAQDDDVREAVGRLCDEGRLDEAVESLDSLHKKGVRVSSGALHLLLLGCSREKDLACGRRVRALISSTGYESNAFLHNHLIRLFAACRSLWEADQVFRSGFKPDAYTWQAIISAHAHSGQGEQAIKLYREMLQSDVRPNNHVNVAVLKACANAAALGDGREVHAHICEAGSDRNLFVGNTLMDMYAKCGSLVEARTVFDRLVVKDVVSWNTIIGACLQHGQVWQALELFQEMEVVGMKLSQGTAVSIVKACGSIAALDEGMRVHAQLKETGLELDAVVGTTLVSMYVKCGSLDVAVELFSKLPEKAVVSWNALIAGYVQQGRGQEAFQLLKRMQDEGVKPDRLTFLTILRASQIDSSVLADRSAEIHKQVVGAGYHLDVDIGNALVKMYGRLSNLSEARNVFDGILEKNVESWSTMIAEYADHGQGEEAVQLFEAMKQQGLTPDKFTFTHLLKACTHIPAPAEGKQLHSQLIECGLELDTTVANTLIAMYARFGAVDEARDLFERLPERTVASWNAVIGGYAQHGLGVEALQLFTRMQKERVKPDRITVMGALKGCASIGALLEGKQIHEQLIERDIKIDVAIGSSLVDMYAKCGSLDEARKLFDTLPERSVVSWNSLIGGYVQHKGFEEVLRLYKRMQVEGVEPNRVTFLAALKACSSSSSVEQGKQIHAHVIELGLGLDSAIGNTLVDMYGGAGNLDDARNIFRKLPQRDIVSWNAIIGAYTQHGQSQEALHLFSEMLKESMVPDRMTFLSLLKACQSREHLSLAKTIHAEVLKHGLEKNDVIGSTLVDMYARCGSMQDAQKCFDTLSSPDVVSWTVIIGGYAQDGDGERALILYEQMLQAGIEPDKVTFLAVVQAAGSIAALEKVKQVQAQVTKSGVQSDVVLKNALVDTYAKCGCLDEARKLFDGLTEKTIVSWNTMIAGYVQHGQGQEGLLLFEQMQQKGLEPDKVTILSILKGCGTITALDEGKQIHAQLLERGLKIDDAIGNALMTMYVKCGSMDEAHKVFHKLSKSDVISWTVLIGGYAQQGDAEKALQLFQHMLQEGIQPDKATYLSILRACSSTAALAQGKEIHTHLVNSGMESDAAVTMNLVDMYVKCGRLDEARELFDKLPEKSVACWNALIGGYAQHGISDEAFKLFLDMQNEGTQPNKTTFLSILKDSGSLAAVKQLHSQVTKSGLQSDEVIGNTLLDMYAKCGSLDEARRVFDSLPERTVVSWNAIIGGYAQHGQAKTALELFQQMQQEGIKPNEVTLISVLFACSHSGLVDEGCQIFTTAAHKLGITFTMAHYACMVDLLSRAGHFQEAEDFINRMPVPAEASLWMSVLGACQTHNNVEVAARAFHQLIQIDPGSAAPYVLMSNIYAAAGRTQEAAEVRKQMKLAGVSKQPGTTWIEAENQVHRFVVDDLGHPQRKAIYDKLDSLIENLHKGSTD